VAVLRELVRLFADLAYFLLVCTSVGHRRLSLLLASGGVYSWLICLLEWSERSNSHLYIYSGN